MVDTVPAATAVADVDDAEADGDPDPVDVVANGIGGSGGSSVHQFSQSQYAVAAPGCIR